MTAQRGLTPWEALTLAELEALGTTDEGVQVNDVGQVRGATVPGNYRCTAVAAGSSTWVINGGASAGGLVELAAIDFSTVTATDYKAGGDGNYTVGGVSCRVGGSASAPQLQATGSALRIGIIGSKAMSGGNYTAPTFGVWLPATARIGLGMECYAVAEFGTSTISNAANKSFAAIVREVGAGSGLQHSQLLYQTAGSGFIPYARDTVKGASTTTSSALNIGATLPAGVGVGLTADGATHWRGTDATDLDTWARVGASRKNVGNGTDPWSRPNIATPSGVIFDFAVWNTSADASAQYLEIDKISIWGFEI